MSLLMQAETALARRVVNALISDARPISGLGWNVAFSIWIFRKCYGGLWVGGILDLFEDRLVFAANDLNRSLTEGTLDLTLSLSKIRVVKSRFGLVTGIIDITTDDGRTSFRCYGSKEFAASIVEAAQAAQNRTLP